MMRLLILIVVAGLIPAKSLTAEPAVRCVVKAEAAGGEGPLWDARRGVLLWLDIGEPSVLHVYDPATGRDTAERLPERVSALMTLGERDYAALVPGGVARLFRDGGAADGAWRCERMITVDARAGRVTNDGRCDARGRFAVGVMDRALTRGGGEFFIAERSGKVTKFAENMALPNGVDWSPDGRWMYVVDSWASRIDRYAYNLETGAVGARETLLELPGADGMCADARGNLWVALCGVGKVVCVDPTARRVVREIAMPVPNVTSCVLGGRDGNTLYVTSAHFNRAATRSEHPLTGSLFAVELGGRGGGKSPADLADCADGEKSATSAKSAGDKSVGAKTNRQLPPKVTDIIFITDTISVRNG